MKFSKKTRKSEKLQTHAGSTGEIEHGKSMSKQKLVVSPKSPIQAKYVAGLKRVTPDKGVWLLTGKNNEKVIIKFEDGSGVESPGTFRGRVEAVNYLAKNVLPRVPKSYRLVVPEVEQLFKMAKNYGDATLQQRLEQVWSTRGKKGQEKDDSTPVAAIVKIDYVDMGDNLLERAEDSANLTGNWANQAQALLLGPHSDEVWSDMGRMAAFDLLVINSDRFGLDGHVGLENIDFSAGNAPRLVPLDNVDKKASIASYETDDFNTIYQKTGNLHPALYASFADNSAVMKYSQTALTSIGKAIGARLNVAGDQPGPELLNFMAGFFEGKKKLWDMVNSSDLPAIEKTKVAAETTVHWQWLRTRIENIGADSDQKHAPTALVHVPNKPSSQISTQTLQTS